MTDETGQRPRAGTATEAGAVPGSDDDDSGGGGRGGARAAWRVHQ